MSHHPGKLVALRVSAVGDPGVGAIDDAAAQTVGGQSRDKASMRSSVFVEPGLWGTLTMDIQSSQC